MTGRGPTGIDIDPRSMLYMYARIDICIHKASDENLKHMVDDRVHNIKYLNDQRELFRLVQWDEKKKIKRFSYTHTSRMRTICLKSKDFW